MSQRKQQIIEQCVSKLANGSLTERYLREAFGSDCDTRQDLLYLQAVETGLESKVVGMRMLIDGQFVDEPNNDDDWPYESVIDAIQDGWRVISFPNMALCLDENRTYGLGFEFILEKWR